MKKAPETKINYKLKKIKQVILSGNESNEKTKLKKVLLSLIIITLSVTCVITVTSALFTGKKEVETHVTTGNLSFELTRTKLVGKELDNNTGLLKDFESTEVKDLSETGVDAFGVNTLVPGSTYTATFNLKNVGTTAFTSKISFTNLEGSNEYLLKQIKVTTVFNNVTNYYTLDQYSSVSLDLGVLNKGNDLDFQIGLELLSTTNNDAQSSSANFDLRLEATQVTE